ncbi:MAG: saccharopine dehydrogenase NADP-binding domain-containing protein [Haliscomenobacter sp.]|nr:saccharopine dehydrogenase NADP-binding domain-containing protein [Haliscomenobacter sp.]
MKNILIIGGYGNTGRQIGQLLLDRREDVHLIVAGRDLRKAEQMAADLNCRVGRDRARGIALDLSDPDQMDKAFLQADFVVNASSTLLYVRPFLEALLRQKGRNGYPAFFL